MGLTLIEAAKYENRLEHLAVLKTFSEGELLAQLPFMNIAGSGLFYSAEQELPSVGFRAVNEGYTQSYGVVDQRAEAVHLFGGDVDWSYPDSVDSDQGLAVVSLRVLMNCCS
jgi:hypothetical protein